MYVKKQTCSQLCSSLFIRLCWIQLVAVLIVFQTRFQVEHTVCGPCLVRVSKRLMTGSKP